jgi:hypothetical protein
MKDANKPVGKSTEALVVRLAAGSEGVVVATGTRRAPEGREGPELEGPFACFSTRCFNLVG